jgi:seryl-tRNA synthetase
VTPEGLRLDRHLRQTIDELSGRHSEKDQSMRGIQRLANAAGNLMKQADAEADAAAAELEEAYADQANVAKRYSAFAKQVSAATKEALDNLNQISNIPLPDGADLQPQSDVKPKA